VAEDGAGAGSLGIADPERAFGSKRSFQWCLYCTVLPRTVDSCTFVSTMRAALRLVMRAEVIAITAAVLQNRYEAAGRKNGVAM